MDKETVKDIVEVVRCRDCVSYGIHSISGHPLSYDCYTNAPDDFCSKGQRKIKKD